jgi:TonB-dependent starch-binding outer membrane protein SusC
MYKIIPNIGVPMRLYHKILLIMRLTTVLLIASLVQVSAAGFAQKITLSKTNASLKMVLKELRQQSGFDFIATEALLERSKSVNLKVKDMELEDVLENIFDEQPLTYTIENKTVTLKAKEPSFLDNLLARFTDIDVRGRVVDEQGNPLPNASIQVKGKAKVYNSNDKGEFNISNVTDDAILVVRYVGYKPLEISLKDAVMPLEIKLNVATGELEEVKVTYSTGYQNIPKERSTGSFVQLSNEDINRNPSPKVLDRILSITNSLKFESQIAGSGGNNGNGTNISIRGYSTINADMRPLIVVDGFPYQEFNIPNTNTLNQNLLNNLNPNDIESITILRDAAAASIWGARSGNGVIVITTKKGKYNQTTKIQFSSNIDITGKPDLKSLRIISSTDRIEFEKKRFASGFYNQNDDLFPGFKLFPSVPQAIETLLALRKGKIPASQAQETLDKMAAYDVRDDVDKYFLQSAISQQYNANVSGGNDKMNYYSSIGYNKNRGNDRGNNSNLLTLRFENTYRPVKSIQVNTYINYVNSKDKNNGSGYLNLLSTSFSPYTQLADETGKPLHVPTNSTFRTAYIDTLKGRGLYDWHYRPIDEQKLNNNASEFSSVRLGGKVNYKFNSFLTFEISGQYEKGVQTTTNIQNVESYAIRNEINQFMYYNAAGIPQYPFPVGGRLTSVYSVSKSWNIRNQLNLNKSWIDHQINGIFGLEQSERKFNSDANIKYGFDSERYLFKDVDHLTLFTTRPSGSRRITSGGQIGSTTDRFTSYFGNAGYTFLNKYSVSLSGRIDASNFFGSNSNDRMTPLYSTGFSWNIAQETWYKIEWLKYLKLRATYGYNGNMNNKASALPTAMYDATGAVLNLHGESVLKLLTPANPGLTWEQVRTINLGLDFSMFENRITGSIDYYAKEGTNLIGNITVDVARGFGNYVGNYANMKGKGFDANINSINIDKVLKWNTVLNFSYNTDKITKYLLPADAVNNVATYVSVNSPIVGKPLQKIYAYPFGGLNGQNGDPMGYVNQIAVDYNTFLSQGKPNDLIYLGSSRPLFYGNIMNTFSYKDLSLSCNVTYSFKYFLRRPSVEYVALYNTWSGHSDYSLRWKSPGDELMTNIPSLPSSANGNRDSFFRNSESLIFKGDHVRLQDVRLNIDLSKKLFDKTKRSLQVYFYASNLGIIWRANKENIDPDYIRKEDIPPSKRIALGITLGL